ncbi:hypothetical protein NQ315_004710, partial [Exocentrus adspersus]
VYQIAYIIIKAANSPRPGTWILEKSIDGDNFEPWQYFARSDKECIERFGIPATKGKPHYFTDSEVICTSFFSKLTPMENGEIHTSLVHGRPGANETSPELLEFTKARYVRLRLMGIRGTQEPLPRRFSQDIWKDKRLFYSIRDISIGGQCVCNGHAENCRYNVASGHPECECQHNTCGPNCENCCSMYHQRQWSPGTSRDAHRCLPCNCHGHATSCHYDEEVDKNGLSLDMQGNYQGGGVCNNCSIRSLKDWLITDLKVSKVVKPKWDGQRVFSLGNYGFHEIKSLYWLAPEEYLGNKLEAYNSNFLFKVQWDATRGDTSGKPIQGPNMILVSGNGLKIAYGNDFFTSGDMTFDIKLNEAGWYALSNDINDVTKLSKSEYRGRSVTREEFLEVLVDLKYILLRASFHADQVEALLEEATLNLGNDNEAYSSVEKCSCPSGYTGLSCESCSFGYVRIYANTSNSQEQGFCGKCDCNGHSQTCNPNTGECFCQHNTIGEKCERCAPGFYGNPLRGTPTDCKRCACPLLNEENNFSPSCQLDFFVERVEDEGNYVCTQCPEGYTGDHCDICDDGYYGNPLEIGNSCQPCDCHGGPCDRLTGQCLRCKGNTEGWKCERCKPEHYGDAALANCKACECDPIGSISKQCDNVTGQCQCKERFTGRTCSRCEVGYGNVTALCTACSCNPVGSKSEICDTHSGMCDCQPGVEGFHCDACQNFYFGFSETGCEPCNCNEDGSKFQTCNSTGACVCKLNYVGRTCDICKDGFWKNRHKECVECTCNEYGSAPNTYCDKETGVCHCKEGVTGDDCDVCMPQHYGTIETSCKECDPCNKTGHICDPQNGKCVCPPLTEGESCEQCVEFAWGYEPGIGCKACECSERGSSNLQCDEIQGRCTCKLGYQGDKCNKCSFGYYGYPNCQKCNCNLFGTVEDSCQDGDCKCSSNGSCSCKENVYGHKCDSCKAKTFGLTKENPNGCTPCFCFERSNVCSDAHLNWDKIRTQKINNDTEVIDLDYWKLPNKFMGDLTTSYGGYLTVDVKEGHFRVTLEGNGARIQSSGNNELQLIESNWNIASGNSQFPEKCQTNLTRSCFMVILQNVTSLVVQANDRIREILLDSAKSNLASYPPSHSIEKCECPKEYTGLSCQDPHEGYFRYHSKTPNDKWIDAVTGEAKLCECNGKSQLCDKNTGACRNCTDNTSGDHCELCDVGYYMDNENNCLACLCPVASQNNAESCSPIDDTFICNCKKGYNGQFCNSCDEGYFDKAPNADSVVCESCNCNPFGSVHEICNEFGICECKAGFKGEKCNLCVNDREYIENGVCTPCDECSRLLFAEIDDLVLVIEDTFDLFKDGLNPPWKVLSNTIARYQVLSAKFLKKQEQSEHLLQHSKIEQCEKKVNKMLNKIKKSNETVSKNIFNTDKIHNFANVLLNKTEDLNQNLIDLIENLESFGAKHVNLKHALKEAKEVLKHIQKISRIFDKHEEDKILNFCTKVSHKRAAKLKEQVEKIKSINQNLEDNLSDIVTKTNVTQASIPVLEEIYGKLQNMSAFTEYSELEQWVRQQTEENIDIEDVSLKAVDHVQELETKIDSYKNIFNFTKDEWKKINASGAYEAIVNGIKEARDDVEFSEKMLETALKVMNPTNSDNIVDKTNLAHAYSDRLKQRINNLKDLTKSVTIIKNKLDHFKYGILKSGKENNDINQILQKMELDITSQGDTVSKLEEAVDNSTGISEDMRQIERNAQDIIISAQTRLIKKHHIYLNLTSDEEINKFNAKLSDTRRQLENLNIGSNFGSDKHSTTGNKNLQAIQEKIEGLRNRIYYAKQAADAINVAMNISNCRTSYNLPQIETFQSLSITFKCDMCQLFKLTNDDGDINLEIDDYNIILRYNNKNILIPNSAEDKEKTVNIQKLGSLIKMQVDNGETKQIETDLEYYIIHPNDRIEIGSTDNRSEKKSYIYNIMLNGKKFGLWKFSRTEGACTGEIRDATDKQIDNVNLFFNGKGYVVYGKNNKLNPTKLTLRFDFSTFDENNLIYLASYNDNSFTPSEDNCAYIILFLKDGYLNFIARHSNGLNSSLTLENKYNVGRMYHAEIITEYDSNTGIQHYILSAWNETFQERKINQNKLYKKNVFKIKQAFHYVGGTPPVFNSACLPINMTSFLGFLKLTSQLSNEVISYGITKTGKQSLEFHQAWINTNGYIKVKVIEEPIESLSFILRPISPSGLIMKFGQHNISLNNYKVVVNGLVNSYDRSLEKDDYNIIKISIAEGILWVNRNEKSIHIPVNTEIKDYVTIGGKYEKFKGGINNILINKKELIFTRESLVEFVKVDIGREPPSSKSSSKEKSVKSLTTHITNSMQNTENTEGCASFANYETDRNAVKFGDKSDSYTLIKANFWKGDYNITFQFRTFYPNGMIFVTIGNQKQQHYNLLQLMEGQLGLYFKGRKKMSPIILKEKLNDGRWHSLEIFKRKRKVAITLDEGQKKTVKVPKTVVRSEMFLGGVPLNSDYLNVNDLRDKLHQFRGCMKALIINDEHQLIKNKGVHHNNIRQCFPNVEEGAYFGGDAFAIYKENFHINKILELSFEFKTAEQNGILLSVSNYRNSPALSVELQNGAVVMAVDMGNGATSNVTNNLDSDFALCNNRWHNVTAMYSSSELTVNVDGILKIWVQSDLNSLMDEIDAPLYIGGLPDNAPVGTLKSRENFKGCIRKLKIENRLMDWSDMRELKNVLLNSCPVEHKNGRHRNILETTNYTIID